MKKWKAAEQLDQKLFNTTGQRGSGNQDHYPTDSFSDDFAVETKQTDKGSYSLSVDKWIKLCNEAAVLDAKDGRLRIPIMSLHIKGKHLVVLSYEDVQHLYHSI